MANIRVTVEAESAATPEQVYAFVTDPPKMNDWVKGVTEASWDEGSGPEPGGTFNMKYRYSRRINEITMEVTAAEPGRRFAYHTILGKYPIEADIELVPSGGGTRIRYTQNALSDSPATALAFKLTSWISRPMMRRGLKKDIEKLAAAAAGE